MPSQQRLSKQAAPTELQVAAPMTPHQFDKWRAFILAILQGGPVLLLLVMAVLLAYLGTWNPPNWVAIASAVITFLGSLVMLINSTLNAVLAIRRDRREQESAQLDNKKKELEIVKLRADVEKLETKDGPKIFME